MADLSVENELQVADLSVKNEEEHSAFTPVYLLSDHKLLECFDDEDDRDDAAKDLDTVRKYLKQVDDTEGFDIDVEPKCCVQWYVSITPRTVSKELFPEEYEDYRKSAEVAIEKYNDQEQTGFSLVEVLKVNGTMDYYDTYYITFEAHDVNAGEVVSKVFQARVSVKCIGPPPHDDIYVVFCRLRPS